jgi:hypothetical protein
MQWSYIEAKLRETRVRSGEDSVMRGHRITAPARGLRYDVLVSGLGSGLIRLGLKLQKLGEPHDRWIEKEAKRSIG